MITRLKKETFLLIGLLLLAGIITFATHYGAIDNMTTSFDDHQYLINNPLVRNPSIDSVKIFFKEITNPSTVGGYYQPLTMISLMLDYKISGGIESFFVFHLHSLILHIINVLLVILILYSLFKNKYIAFICGIIFGTHPMTVEVISWVSERKTPLATVFSLTCILFYILFRQKGRKTFKYISIFALLLSLLAKPIGIFIPIALVLLDVWPLCVIKREKFFISILNNIIAKYAYFTISAVSGWITVLSQSTSGELKSVKWVDMVYKFSSATYFYIAEVLIPVGLSPHHPIPDPLNLSNNYVIIGLVATILIFTSLIFSLKRTKVIFIGYSIYLVIIFPVMGIKEFNDIIGSDKFLYLSGIGLLMIVYKLLDYLYFRYKSSENPKKHVVLAISIILLLTVQTLFINTTIAYTEKWKDTITHYTYLLEVAPSAVHLNFDLAREYARIGEYKKSIDAYKKLIDAKEKNQGKNMAVIHINIGVNYHALGDYENARKSFENALVEDPQDVKALMNLANLFRADGQLDKSIEYLLKATESIKNYYQIMTSNDREVRKKLGNAYNNVNELSVDLFNTYKVLGIIYFEKKDINNATEYLKAAYQLSNQLQTMDLELEKAILKLLYEKGEYPTAEEKVMLLIQNYPYDPFLIEFKDKIFKKKIEIIKEYNGLK